MVKCTHTFRTVQICKCSRYPYQNWNPSRHIRLTDCCNPYTYFFLFQVYILMGLKKPKNQSRDHEHHFNCAYGKRKTNNSIEYMLLENLLNISLFMNLCMQLLTVTQLKKVNYSINSISLLQEFYEIKIKYRKRK